MSRDLVTCSFDDVHTEEERQRATGNHGHDGNGGTSDKYAVERVEHGEGDSGITDLHKHVVTVRPPWRVVDPEESEEHHKPEQRRKDPTYSMEDYTVEDIGRKSPDE